MAAPAYKPVVKNGMFYHVYGYGTPQEEWRLVRQAAATNGAPPPPGAAPPPVPGVAAPVVPQAPPPPPTPFMSADDMMSQNNFWSQWNTTFSDLDAALAKLRTDTTYQQSQLDQSHKQSRAGNDWNAAARGLERSSVKDGNTAQIETDYTRGTNQLKDNLHNAETDTAQRKNYFNTVTLPAQQAAWNQKAAENAMAASYNAPPPASGSAPAPAHAPAGGAAPPTYKNVVKNGMFYHVYNYGKPGEKWVTIRQASGTG